MNSKALLFIVGLCIAVADPAVAQPAASPTTLQACYEAAEAYAPVARQSALSEQARGYTLENAARGWWPQLQFEARAQVQSDVTQLPFDLSSLGLSGFKMKKDQYAATLALQQPLYDGGAVKAEKKVAEAQNEVEQRQTATTLYGLHDQVNQLYFGLLLTREQLRLNALLQNNLELNLRRAEALQRGGLAHEADLDVVRVEQLKAEQAKAGYQSTERAYAAMLARLTGWETERFDTLATPDLPAAQPTVNMVGERRPEMKLYAARLGQIDASLDQLSASWRPRVSLFAQGGYGRPGLNMLDDGFSLYGVAGVRLTWNISRLYTRRRDEDLLRNRAERIRAEQDAFSNRVAVDEAQRREAVARYEALLAHDDEIVALRQRIRQSGEARYAGGTLTATDLMRYLNDEQQARLDRALHAMQRLLAAYDLRHTQGE